MTNAKTPIPDMAESPYAALASSGYVPLTLRIGVTGHRMNKLIADKRHDNERDISEAYGTVTAALADLNAQAADRGIVSKKIPPIVRLVSSLAEGADRLFASPDLAPPDAQLAGVLPFLRSEYETDFGPEGSLEGGDSVAEFAEYLRRADYGTPDSRVLELTDTADSRSDSYRRAGAVVVNHSDLLIALFDGEDNDLGGTSSTIREARRCSLPVIVIDSMAIDAPMLLAAGGHDTTPVPLTVDALRDELARSLLLRLGEDGATDGPAIADFSGECGLEQPADGNDDSAKAESIVHLGKLLHWVPPAFQLLKDLFVSQAGVNKLLKKWGHTTPQSDERDATQKQHRATQRVDAAYQRADALAVHYATAHRNTFVAIYMLGAAALIAAALGLAGLALDAQSLAQSTILRKLPLICVIAEVFFLLGIFVLYKRDHALEFHQKWLEYRSLAELLRPQKFFAIAGCASGLTLIRRLYRRRLEPSYGPDQHDDGWIYVYAANVIRWAGFEAGPCDAARRQRDKATTLAHWLYPQVAYHESNSARMHIMETWLARFGVISFWVTLAVVSAKLGDKLGHWFSAKDFQVWAGFLAALFPVLGTFAFAVRNHAEFGISAKRSAAMRDVFISMIDEFQMDHVSRNERISNLERVFATAIDESAEWRSIYEVKESETA